MRPDVMTLRQFVERMGSIEEAQRVMDNPKASHGYSGYDVWMKVDVEDSTAEQMMYLYFPKLTFQGDVVLYTGDLSAVRIEIRVPKSGWDQLYIDFR